MIFSKSDEAEIQEGSVFETYSDADIEDESDEASSPPKLKSKKMLLWKVRQNRTHCRHI